MTALTASSESRTITGLVVPYGEFGMTSAGRVDVAPGAIRLPSDLARIKLLNFHTNEVGGVAESIGYAIQAQETPQGLLMTFKLGSSPAADRALADAGEGLKDGLSVELANVKTHGNRVQGGDLTAVAHVPLPAFESSRIASLAAQAHYSHDHHPTQGEPMSEQTPETPEVEDPQVDAPEVEEADEDDEDDKQVEVETKVTAAARRPATLTAGRSSAKKASGDLRQLFAAVSGMTTGHASPELTAALSDIGYNSSPWAVNPKYVGELWSGVGYQRKFWPMLRQQALTSLKVKGWRWVTPPVMANYAGDKAAIPSGTVATEEISATASRLATGNDIDRAYWDLGELEFIESYFRKCAESYAKVSDARAEAFIYASQSGTTDLGAGGDLLEAVAVAVQEVEEQTGEQATGVIVNSTDFRQLLSISASDIPAFLREFLNIEPGNFVRSANQTAGRVTALTRSAVDAYELGSTPIRVQAEHIANGGKDIGVFGYTAFLLEHATAVRKVEYGA